jgi:tetratricopeptide (TPR) repeat protein
LGSALRNSGDYQAALEQLEHGLEIVRTQNDRPEALNLKIRSVEINLLNTLGLIYRHWGDRKRTDHYLRQALDVAEREECWRPQVMVLGSLASLASERGNYDKAIRFFERALQIAPEIKKGITLGNLGNVFLKLGAFDKARSCYDQALLIHREIEVRKSEAYTLGNLGLLHHYLGENKSARDLTQQALKIAQEIGDRVVQGAMWMKLGHALTGLGQLDEATQAYRESVTFRRSLGQSISVAEPLAGLACLALIQGNLHEAGEYVEEILGIIGECENLDGLIDPFQVCLTCFQVLQSIDDPRDFEVLRYAYHQLQSWATRISDDELRQSFLENISSHREIARQYDAFEQGDEIRDQG